MSPMAGYSDSPFRQIVRESGSSFTFTEFVSSEAIVRNSTKTFKMLQFKQEERPIIFQVFGSDPEVIEKASLRIEELKPDAIDLNMGCSVKKVAHKGSGAGLLKKPLLVKKIIRKMKRSLLVPVTAKIRLGWDHSSLNYLEIARILEGEGVSCIFVHGRTKSMGYSGKADWDKIAEIKNIVQIPVFGNGDILSFPEALKKIEGYGVNGVLIGRAAQGNPWIFLGQDRDKLNYNERYSLIRKHFDLLIHFYGHYKGIRLFRKHFVQYVKGLKGASSFRNKMLSLENYDEVIHLLEDALEFIP